jgi:predicted RNA methylase
VSESPDAALRVKLAQAGYTPGRRDVAPLVALLADDADAGVVVRRALARADAAVVVTALVRALAAADEPTGVRLVPALGDVAARAGDATAALIALLDDARPRVRRAAVQALGKVGGDEARAALVAYWDRADLPPDHRRAAAEALGKVGGDAPAPRLEAIAPDAGGDAELARRRGKALLIAERDADDAESEVALDVAPAAPVVMVARCRSGLETLLAGELHDAGLPIDRLGPGLVGTVIAGPLKPLLSARMLLTAGVLVELRPSTRAQGALAQDERVAQDERTEAIARAMADAEPLLAAWTRGPVRWRLEFEKGGHRRAQVWAAAARTRELAPALRNQPRDSTWEVVVTADEQHMELRPHRYTDDRFAWRVADVPAASHPTIAAALARIGGARPGEQVWDPFCGSGAELCERGRLGAAHLHGTDLDERALDATRANLAAAGLTATLTRADALDFTPPAPLGLVITNPPLGRRVRGDAGALLEAFAARVPRLLARGGRLAWITPAAERTANVLRRGGLELTFARHVDLGGYEARMERWARP